MKKCLTFLLVLWFLTVPVFAQPQSDVPQALHEAAEGICALLGTRDPLADGDLLAAGDSSGDWIAFTFALAGEKAAFRKYGRRLEAYVSGTYAQSGSLGAYSATQGQRIVLTATALGLDPTSFGGTIDLLADCTYNYRQADETLFDQGLNACIFALIALDSKDYPVPPGSRCTRTSLLDYLLSCQNDDGGFGLTKGGADADVTAMAVQAMAAHTDDPAVLDAAQRALDWLSGQLDASGLFPSRASETISQTIIALAAMGFDPQTEPRFVRNGVSPAQILETYRQPDGSFAHSPDDGGNVLATQQAMLALLAMEKQKDGLRLYDLSAVPVRKNARPCILFLIPAGAAVFMAAAVCYMIRRKKHHG